MERSKTRAVLAVLLGFLGAGAASAQDYARP